MGIEKLILEHNTTEEGLFFVNTDGGVEAAFSKGAETSFTSQYEILRGSTAIRTFTWVRPAK
jgi:hypothetical protein